MAFRALQDTGETNPRLPSTRLNELPDADVVEHDAGGGRLTQEGGRHWLLVRQPPADRVQRRGRAGAAQPRARCDSFAAVRHRRERFGPRSAGRAVDRACPGAQRQAGLRPLHPRQTGSRAQSSPPWSPCSAAADEPVRSQARRACLLRPLVCRRGSLALARAEFRPDCVTCWRRCMCLPRCRPVGQPPAAASGVRVAHARVELKPSQPPHAPARL